MSPMLAAALAYAERGWAVFPVAAGSKVPAIPRDRGGRGLLDATTDPQRISAWWTEYPDANVGISCGPSGLFVVDVDAGHGGEESLVALRDEFGDGWLDTATVLTPGGGAHYYLGAGSDGADLASKVGVRKGIDIRAKGGYVVAPPSHRLEGAYRWADGRSLSDCALIQVPEWLARLTGCARPPAQPLEGTPAEIAEEGQRNERLTSLAGTMRRRGMSEDSIRAALLQENRSLCRPPLADSEVAGIARSVARYAPAPSFPTRPVQPLFSHSSLLSQVGGPVEWPEPPGEDAFLGLAGEIVHAVDPHTEADSVAVLANVLTAFGNAVGPGPHFMVGATRHYPREFMALVGRSSKARKGDSWQPIRTLFGIADPEWTEMVAGGLSTGEGLIHAVRDQVEKQEPVKEKGKIVGYQAVIADEGVQDKRLLVVESELAKVLRVMERQGNSLSPVLRSGWDSGDLRVMTRSNPLRATNAHISLLGHITVEELLRELPDVEMANGFANRFIWVSVKRSKLLPDPEPFQGLVIQQLAQGLAVALGAAREIGQMTRDAAAADLWADVYGELSDEHEGLASALLARAEAHVLRLSMIYALLDASAVIRIEHLSAALEMWGYAERSVRHIFGDATGDPLADTVLKALQANDQMTRTDISALFGRHESAARIGRALQVLFTSGRAQMSPQETGGRPVEVWQALA